MCALWLETAARGSKLARKQLMHGMGNQHMRVNQLSLLFVPAIQVYLINANAKGVAKTEKRGEPSRGWLPRNVKLQKWRQGPA